MKHLLLSLLFLLTLASCGREPVTSHTVQEVEKDSEGCWCWIYAKGSAPKAYWVPCADSVKVGTTVTLQFIYE